MMMPDKQYVNRLTNEKAPAFFCTPTIPRTDTRGAHKCLRKRQRGQAHIPFLGPHCQCHSRGDEDCGKIALVRCFVYVQKDALRHKPTIGYEYRALCESLLAQEAFYLRQSLSGFHQHLTAWQRESSG